MPIRSSMQITPAPLLWRALCLLTLASLAAPAAPDPAKPLKIVVDGAEVIARGSAPLTYGICMDHIIDSDRFDPDRKHKIRDSLKALGVKAVRWNEGETGDKMIWSIPPFGKPDVHATHLRTPGTVHYNWRVNHEDGSFKHPVMELDEAIAIARDLESQLFIIVGIDAIWVESSGVRGRDTKGETDETGEIHKRMSDFPWATEGKSPEELIIASTSAMARYLAGHAKGIEVTLEIGNENYLGDASWKPEAYARLVNKLSKVIKRANSQLRVGAQLSHQHPWTGIAADGRSWNQVMRSDLDLGRIDHLVVHQYGYKDTPNLDSAVAFHDSLPADLRKRIRIAITESGSWHLPGSTERWSPNDLHRSLYQFRWLGMLQQNGKGKIEPPLFWNTRWLDVLKKGPYEKTFNAMGLDGALTPSGKAIQVWNRFVGDSLLEVTGARGDFYCYASRMQDKPDQVTVWLANNSSWARRVSLRLRNVGARKISKLYRYGGKGPDDRKPVLSLIGSPPELTFRASKTELCVPSLSILVIQFDRD